MNPFILLFLLVCMTLPFYMPLVHLKMTENLMPIEVNIGFNSTCIKMSVPNIPPISTCNQVPKEISQIIPNFSTIKNLYIAGFTILGIALLLSFKKDMSNSNILFGLLILGSILSMISLGMLLSSVNINTTQLHGDIGYNKSYNPSVYFNLVLSAPIIILYTLNSKFNFIKI